MAALACPFLDYRLFVAFINSFGNVRHDCQSRLREPLDSTIYLQDIPSTEYRVIRRRNSFTKTRRQNFGGATAHGKRLGIAEMRLIATVLFFVSYKRHVFYNSLSHVFTTEHIRTVGKYVNFIRQCEHR